MLRTPLRLAVTLLTFTLGLTTVWLTTLGAQLAAAALDRLMPTPALEQPAEPPLCDSVADTYAVYSALLNQMREAREGRLLVVKAETDGYPDEEEETRRQRYGDSTTFAAWVQRALPQAATDTLTNYRAANERQSTLRPLFCLNTNYALVSEAELERLAGGRKTLWLWLGLSRKYPAAKRLYGLSAVGFNRTHTQALVYVWHTCGGECGGGSYALLEKRAGAWQVAGWMGLWIS